LQEYKRSSLLLPSVSMNKKKRNNGNQGSLQNAYNDVIVCFLNVINLQSEKHLCKKQKIHMGKVFCSARNRAFLKFGFNDNTSFKQLPAIFLKFM